jgi:hypothetical protein
MMPTGQAASARRESDYGEHLLVWSWRRIVEGRIHCPVMAYEFAEACGDAGSQVFAALCVFLRALAAASRRRLAFCAPNPFDVTADERQTLTLLAAAQAEDHALFQAHLSWLARPQQRHELQAAAYALAAALKANRLPLALPPPATPDGHEWLRAVTSGKAR